MPWPFGSLGSSSTPDKKDIEHQPPTKPAPSWNDAIKSNDSMEGIARRWGPIGLTVIGTLAALGFWQQYLRRFSGATSVQESFFRRRTLFGKVTSVGDGDGFHLFHTPGGRLAGWGWLRKIPQTRANLKGNTASHLIILTT